MADSFRFSVVIVSLNGRARIAMPLDALRRCDPAPHEVVLVDNGSSDGLSEFVAENYPEVVLVRSPRNLGFAGGNNLGILNATGNVIVLLNDDTEPAPDWLAPVAEALVADRRLGLVGCLLVYPGGTRIQHLGGIVHANGLTDHTAWGDDVATSTTLPAVLPAEYVTGAAMAIRREVVASVGLLDVGYWPIYFEELDFCVRAQRRGWRCAVARHSLVVHHESQTTKRFSPNFLKTYHRNRFRFLLKNRDARGLWRALRAEARWLAGHAPWDQFWPCALAWGWLPFILADVARERWRGY